MSNPVYRTLKKALILSPLAIPIGIVLSYVILAILLGNPNDVFTLMALSIICTAGISLIIWVPIWYGLGYLVVMLANMILKAAGVDVAAMFGKKPNTATNALQTTPDSLDQNAIDTSNLTKDQVALINYIRKAQQKGLSNDTITQNLGKNGWNTDSISQAFRLVEQG